MINYIPVYQPNLCGNELKYVEQCLRSGWISSKGEFNDRFEKTFANYLQINHATTVSNGTVALHIALLALGIGQNDEVIIPTLTYIASVNALAYVGAIPIFVDSEPNCWNMDVSQIEAKITKKTKAIMAVHIYGAPCNMDSLRIICDKHGLLLIEDVAEAFGSQYKGKFAGTFGDVATFSFFGNKTITTGEGGMVVSDNEETIQRVAFLKSQAVSKTLEYWHDEIGFNYRMTNVAAAIGLGQLENAEATILKKREVAAFYRKVLEVPCTFQEEIMNTRHTFWMVSILVESRDQRDGLRKFLRESKIETRPLFYPAHTMPVFKRNQSFPVAEDLSARGLNLPSFPSITIDQISYVCDKINHYLSRKSNSSVH